MDDTQYQNLINNLIQTYKQKILTTAVDPRVKWVVFKAEVRDITIKYCKQKTAENKNEIIKLELSLKRLNENVENLQNNNAQNRINNAEKKLENLYINEAKGAQIRSRVKWTEEGEKNTKLFIGLEKSRQTHKNICALTNEKGEIITDSSEILKLEKTFYENWYKSTNPNENEIKKYITETKVDKTLSHEGTQNLEGERTIKECTEAI